MEEKEEDEKEEDEKEKDEQGKTLINIRLFRVLGVAVGLCGYPIPINPTG